MCITDFYYQLITLCLLHKSNNNNNSQYNPSLSCITSDARVLIAQNFVGMRKFWGSHGAHGMVIISSSTCLNWNTLTWLECAALNTSQIFTETHLQQTKYPSNLITVLVMLHVGGCLSATLNRLTIYLHCFGKYQVPNQSKGYHPKLRWRDKVRESLPKGN